MSAASGKSAGKKAAATKRVKYGEAGLSKIALRAHESRKANHAQKMSELERHLTKVARGAVARARRNNLPYSSDLAGWALATMEAQKGRCAMSGVDFDLTALGHGAAPRPYAPSIDRVDFSAGYVPGNIRIVCWAVNLLLGTWGDEPALKIAHGISHRTSARA